MSVLVLMMALGLILGAWLGLQLIGQQGRILMRLKAFEEYVTGAEMRRAQDAQQPPAAAHLWLGLPVGTLAPGFALPDLQGEIVTLDSFQGKPILLIFFNPTCGFCGRMAAELAALPLDSGGGRPLPVILTTGSVEQNREWFSARKILCPVLTRPDDELAATYRAHGTPVGCLIDAEGRIASALAIGAEALLGLACPHGKSEVGIHAAMAGITRPLSASKIERVGLKPDTPAPDFCLPGIAGGEICLKHFRGQRVLLIFSDPHCGPCHQLARRLAQIGSLLSNVQILMVSRGDAEDNRRKAAELGLTVPIVLQKHWEISRLYGRFGTPIGYQITADGVIEAEVAVGADAIMALCTDAPARTP